MTNSPDSELPRHSHDLPQQYGIESMDLPVMQRFSG